jgi:hypothetical protein
VVQAFNPNPCTAHRLELAPVDAHASYNEDGLWTIRSHAFVEDDRFRRAHERAVRAARWDCGIWWRVHTILWAAATAASMDGAFVQCGTGRGFMASAICEYLAWNDRPFYLYDTFEPTSLDRTVLEQTRAATTTRRVWRKYARTSPSGLGSGWLWASYPAHSPPTRIGSRFYT